jgi:anti-sigma28 factor (negative regulator of flagellin synthesis)
MDATHLSGASRPKLVRLAAELASQGPPIDETKIARIRDGIALGTYRADPALIAEAMVRYYDGPEQ